MNVISTIEDRFSETDVVVHIATEDNGITTTQNHPFYVEGKGWTSASELEEGDVLHTKEGVTAVVQSVEIEQLDEAVKVYSLEVEDRHTYYVTDERVLVHNDCGNKGGKDGNGPDVEASGESAKNKGIPRENHQVKENGSSLPAKDQPANSSADLLNPDGSVKQRRYYDSDGKAQLDIDFNHTDDGTHEFPHIHLWDWSKKPPRQDSRS